MELTQVGYRFELNTVSLAQRRLERTNFYLRGDAFLSAGCFTGAAFVGSGKPGEALSWQPASASSIVLHAVDDRGRSDERG
jgi:hypothetical protein